MEEKSPGMAVGRSDNCENSTGKTVTLSVLVEASHVVFFYRPIMCFVLFSSTKQTGRYQTIPVYGAISDYTNLWGDIRLYLSMGRYQTIPPVYGAISDYTCLWGDIRLYQSTGRYQTIPVYGAISDYASCLWGNI